MCLTVAASQDSNFQVSPANKTISEGYAVMSGDLVMLQARKAAPDGQHLIGTDALEAPGDGALVSLADEPLELSEARRWVVPSIFRWPPPSRSSAACNVR